MCGSQHTRVDTVWWAPRSCGTALQDMLGVDAGISESEGSRTAESWRPATVGRCRGLPSWLLPVRRRPRSASGRDPGPLPASQDLVRRRLLALVRNLHRLNVLATYRAAESAEWDP